MLGDPPRCATHKTVLTSGGTCLLCMRRVAEPLGESVKKNLLPWATAAVVGGLVILAFVFKIYLSLSDRHPAQAATAEPTGTAAAIAPLPTTVTTGATSVTDAKREVVIEMYGAAWCGYCAKQRAYLDREGIAYTYHDVDLPSNQQPLRQLNPRRTLPTTKVDDQVLVGFSEPSLRRAIDRAAQSRVARRGP